MSQNSRDVLVVEDDPEINRLVGAYVELCGLQYRPALTGQDALESVQEHLPALVILDLMLPDVSGFEVCRRLRNELGTDGVPVLILTALDNDASRQEGRQCGAAEYLTKPFDPDKLIDAVRKYTQ